MDWSLAGYDGGHPIDGDAAAVAACASRLRAVAADVRSQVERLGAVSSREIWESEAAEQFEEVVEDLPEKLQLVATRHERCAEALDTYHPTLGRTKDEAEHWIRQAERAQAEIERCEAGVARMEDFESQAERVAQQLNADREDGEPLREPEPWVGEDYRTNLATAQAELDAAVAHVRSAVGEFDNAAAITAERIRDAGDDDLKNDRSLLGGIKRIGSAIGAGLASTWDSITDVLAEWVIVIDLVASILGVAALLFGWIPVIGQVLIVAALTVGVVSLAAHAALTISGKGSWTDLGFAALGVVTMGAGRAIGSARNIGRGRQILDLIKTGDKGHQYLKKGYTLVPKSSGRPLAGAAASGPLTKIHNAYKPLTQKAPFKAMDMLRPVKAIRKHVRNDWDLLQRGRSSDVDYTLKGPKGASGLIDSRPGGAFLDRQDLRGSFTATKDSFMANTRISWNEHVNTFRGTFGWQTTTLHYADLSSSLVGDGSFVVNAARGVQS